MCAVSGDTRLCTSGCRRAAGSSGGVGGGGGYRIGLTGRILGGALGSDLGKHSHVLVGKPGI